ncbi:MAG: YVTN family beta-propeller repeat protein [Telluria sp.]
MQKQRRWWMAAWALAAAGAGAADPAYRVTDKQVLDGPVRWDYLSMDSERHHLFLTRGDHVDVFDVRTHQVVGTIAGTAGVHGVAVADDLGLGFTSNGAANSVTVFKLDTLAVIGTVAVGAGPDALVYDPATRRVFVANAKGRSLTVVDAQHAKVEATIPLSDSPETAVVDGHGRLFVAIEDKATLAEVDTRQMKLVAEHSVAPVCAEPAGLAIDVQAGLLFAGCHNQKVAVVDVRSGKVVGAAPIGRGNDAVAYDAQRKLAFASNGDGTLTVIDGTAPFAVRATVATMPRARTVALDPATHRLYLSAAEVDAGKPPVNGRPVLKAGSFTVLTVAPD